MRLTPRAESSIERVALGLNLAPVPAFEMLWGMGMSRSLVAAARLGLLGRLARGPATLADLVVDCNVTPTPTRLLLDLLRTAGYLKKRGDTYVLSRRSRKWLDPGSPSSIVAFLEHGSDAWTWWTDLENVVRTGRSFEIHDVEVGDPYWHRYIYAHYQIARLSAPEVATALKLPGTPTSMLDVGGGHGWFSAELCRRQSSLHATVVDLPGSTAVGRQIIAAAGLSDRVTHVDGDVRDAPLGGPHDLALCFNLIHHLRPDAIVELFGRIHDSLRPGATFAVLDLFAGTASFETAAAGAGLFFYLMSGSESYTTTDLDEWLQASGFLPSERVTIRRLPFETLFRTRRAGGNRTPDGRPHARTT